jgi:hypothetical protein
VQPPAPQVQQPTAQRAEAVQTPHHAAPQRRRGGKRIPDAELIGPRGAL